MSRKERRKRKQKRIISALIVFIIVFIGIDLSIEIYKEEKFEKEDYKIKRILVEQYDKEDEIDYPKEIIDEKYKGYQVLAKLEIPKIDLETFVINFSEDTLKISVTKFWGPNPNEVGNFCIAGHNFKNKNMFHNLKKLEIGDKFTVKDNKVGIVNYEIYNIYTVVPEDVSCLSQNTNGKKEVTLITCTNDSKKRIIIKAREEKI